MELLTGFIALLIGFFSGKLHTHIQNSSCMYGLCSISGLDVDVEPQTNKNPIIAENLHKNNII